MRRAWPALAWRVAWLATMLITMKQFRRRNVLPWSRKRWPTSRRRAAGTRIAPTRHGGAARGADRRVIADKAGLVAAGLLLAPATVHRAARGRAGETYARGQFDFSSIQPCTVQ